MPLDTADLVQRVTRYTLDHPDERDPWEKAPAITGVLAWNDDASVQAIRSWIDRAVATQGSEGYLCYPERIELASGHVRTFTPTASLSASIGFLERFKHGGDRCEKRLSRQLLVICESP